MDILKLINMTLAEYIKNRNCKIVNKDNINIGDIVIDLELSKKRKKIIFCMILEINYDLNQYIVAYFNYLDVGVSLQDYENNFGKCYFSFEYSKCCTLGNNYEN